jgi:flagellar motility protein MotE (MotC chaperone)
MSIERLTIKDELESVVEACEFQLECRRAQLQRAHRDIQENEEAITHFETRAAEYRALIAKLD